MWELILPYSAIDSIYHIFSLSIPFELDLVYYHENTSYRIDGGVDTEIGLVNSPETAYQSHLRERDLTAAVTRIRSETMSWLNAFTKSHQVRR